MLRKALSTISILGLAATMAGPVLAGDDHPPMDWGNKQVGDIRSGYTYRNAETRALQDDDFQNPGFLAYDQGEAMWNKVEGSEGKSCASCHGDGAESMATAGTRYPIYDEASGKMMSLEHRINKCRTENMGAEAFKWDKGGFTELTVFVRHQSAGKPVDVAIDGPAEPFFKKGEEIYWTQAGQLQMSCGNCHEDNQDKMIRADHLSQGQINGFPVYRLDWAGVGSTHRRFKGCMENIRATPYERGGEEFTNLELYVAWRGRGLPVETPSVRN